MGHITCLAFYAFTNRMDEGALDRGARDVLAALRRTTDNPYAAAMECRRVHRRLDGEAAPGSPA